MFQHVDYCKAKRKPENKMFGVTYEGRIHGIVQDAFIRAGYAD